MSSNSKRRRSQPSQTHKGDIKEKSQNALGRGPADTSGIGKSAKDTSARLLQKDYLLSKDQSVEGAQNALQKNVVKNGNLAFFKRR